MTQIAEPVPLTWLPRWRPAVPPLQNGDHLTLAEFERRLEAMPKRTRAELIDGVVYMAAALTFEFHGGPQFDFIGILGYYRMATPGVRGADNASVRLDPRTMPQPDIFLVLPPAAGGAVRVDGSGYANGPPELIVEIAATTASYDLHEKLRAYLRNGVREYIVWRTIDGVIDCFVLRNGEYHQVQLVDGLFTSSVFPGLWLNVVALLGGDLQRVLADLQLGVSSPEHAAFVADLQRQADANG